MVLYGLALLGIAQRNPTCVTRAQLQAQLAPKIIPVSSMDRQLQQTRTNLAKYLPVLGQIARFKPHTLRAKSSPSRSSYAWRNAKHRPPAPNPALLSMTNSAKRVSDDNSPRQGYPERSLFLKQNDRLLHATIPYQIYPKIIYLSQAGCKSIRKQERPCDLP